MASRIAIAGFVHETVTFLPVETGLGPFTAAAVWGDELITRFRGSNTVYGGFIAACERAGAAMVPIVATEVPPSGPVSDTAFDHFAAAIVDGIAGDASDINGVLLHLHGAMATSRQQDPERVLLQALRERVGAALPIAVAFDLHANLSPECCALADIVCGFHHSPHTDMAATGERAARLLLRTIDGEIAPQLAVRKPGLVLPSVFTATSLAPLADVMAAARAREAQPGVLDISVFTGFAYADVGCIGAAVVAVTDGDELAANRIAADLAQDLATRRDGLYRRQDLLSVADAVDRAQALVADGRRPVVIVEHADRGNDSTHVLQALIERAVPRVVVPYLTDAVAARAAANTGTNARLMATVGGKSSDLAGDPVLVSAAVRFAGPVCYAGTGPYRTGETIDLGPSAVLQTATATIIVTSTNVVAVDTDPFRVFGLDLDDYDIIVLRSKTHFRAAYQGLAAAIVIAETPDWGRADLSALTYRNVPSGVFPITA